MPKAASAPFLLPQALLEAFHTNNLINQYLLENLPEAVWRAEPPEGKGREEPLLRLSRTCTTCG